MARASKYDRAAVAAYAAGHTSAEVAREFGFPNVMAAASWMSRNGIRCRPSRGAHDEREWQEIALFAPAHTADEVAERFGFKDANSAAASLARRGIPYLKKRDCHAAGTTGNPVYEWLLDHSSCRMCIDLGWERECRASVRSCESFLRSRLRPLMNGT